jgi:galactonate dehydratase
MKIAEIETYTVGAEWKNWLFVKVLTDGGLYGIGEATMNGFIKTTEAAVHELKHFVIGKDPRQIPALTRALLETIQDGGHIHHLATAGIEVGC